jgi:hypothetical protein
VVEVKDTQAEVPLGSEIEEGVEQAHGIGAARDGDTNPLARLEHAVAGDGLSDAVKHGEYASIEVRGADP